ncbi:porin [Yoonia sp. F2084L]|uniref:porin n=1 Tax=Yoonia sp. F2084L TaxID=2926419 RepID=UPI001FF215F4|nr:porin [Yoonia sp. F2084L]MCK0096978.1 porin [Yoonia sp. F2084L]
MKSILLTTTAIVAFAGAAAADGHSGISFAGNAELGFNDDSDFGEDGFYWDADIDVTMSAALDNGLTATAAFEIDVLDDANEGAFTADEYVLSLESDTAGLFFGDTAFAAETRWQSAGDMESDGFSEADGENVIRGDVSLGGFDASVSYNVTHAAGTDADNGGFVNGDIDDALGLDDLENDEFVDQLSVGVAGDVGMFSMSVAYQEESVSVDAAAAAAAAIAALPDPTDADAVDALVDTLVSGGVYAPSVANGDFSNDEIFGISAGVSVAGADITLAYASNESADTSSTGIQVAYPIGPVTATVYYVSEDDDTDEDNFGATLAYSDGPIAVTLDYDNDQGLEKVNLDGSFDVGNGLTVVAGAQNENEGDDTDYYVGGTFDLGGGAEFLAVYANDEDGDQEDEIGDPEYLPGTTLEISFSF